MKRSGIFRRPGDDDDYGDRVVRAKPIDERFARKLGSFGTGKDFVVGSERSQKEFSGDSNFAESTSGSTVLSQDERNKISAKLLKAEMKGDKELIEKLQRKLRESEEPCSSDGTTRLLIKTDKRSGVSMPLSMSSRSHKPSKTSDGKYNLGSVESEYQSEMSVRDMAIEERTSSADDQLTMFNRAAMATAERKTDDDWLVDDAMMSHKRRRKHEERDEAKKRNKAIKEQKTQERTLETCSLCVDSRRFSKHCLVAIGIKTYLCAVPWRPLVDGHCIIVPSAHYSSTVSLDEDVYDEMRIWRKGLVAMWKAEQMDCVFIETAKNVKHGGHMYVECIPLPMDIGETAPIYFKKAINESEGEWSDNRKLLELNASNGDIRRALPKGFAYFAIDFGLQPGYAHIIEDEQRFPRNFAHEIIGGMLDLDHTLWRKIVHIGVEEEKKNSDRLKQLWAPFDWTEKVKKALAEEKREMRDD
uniref:CWF19-like protein 2 n=1 Tax=Ascaris suum TaxID=6253 RepID=F1L4N5_ASCSU